MFYESAIKYWQHSLGVTFNLISIIFLINVERLLTEVVNKISISSPWKYIIVFIKPIHDIEVKSLYLVQFEFSLPKINYSNYKKCASNVFAGVNRKTYCVCSYLTTEIIKLNATLPKAFCTNHSHTHTHARTHTPTCRMHLAQYQSHYCKTAFI